MAYRDLDNCYDEKGPQPLRDSINQTKSTTSRFLQVDKRIEQTEGEINALKELLKSKEVYLKQLEVVRKTVTPSDEAKIQALISCGLL